MKINHVSNCIIELEIPFHSFPTVTHETYVNVFYTNRLVINFTKAQILLSLISELALTKASRLLQKSFNFLLVNPSKIIEA